MKRSALQDAKRFLKRRKFSAAISVLESHETEYPEEFEYLLTMGIAHLYVGVYGSARTYFQRARNIRVNDVRLLLGQAALFLRRGETDRALEYYLDILHMDPNNRQAKNAMEFIRLHGDDYTLICEYFDSGKIQKYFPPLGVNPHIVATCVLSASVTLLFIIGLCVLIPKPRHNWVGPRANLTAFELSRDEKNNALEEDLSGTLVHYILSQKEITKSYENAMLYVEDRRDNAAQVEINRLLNSNASLSIKQKASLLMNYLDKSPTFDSILDNYEYETVASEPELYLDCFVSWSGRISNASSYENGSWYCELLVGYENMRSVKGIVPVLFDEEPSPSVDGEKPVRILGKVGLRDGKVILSGRAVYQPLKGNSLK